MAPGTLPGELGTVLTALVIVLSMLNPLHPTQGGVRAMPLQMPKSHPTQTFAKEQHN